MDTNKIIAINLENAELVGKGVYTNLQCPNCNNRSLEVFFTKHTHLERYGIWFECFECGNVEHISCREKPKGYSANRISIKYQNSDESAWNAENLITNEAGTCKDVSH